METVVQPPADAELHLLTDWGDPGGSSRRRKAAIATVLLHVGVITLIAVLPADFLESRNHPQEPAPIVTPLIEPPTVLTQKAPNKGKITKEFDAREEAPRHVIQMPPSPPPAPVTPKPAVIPAPPAPKPSIAAALPEPPKLDMAPKEAPKIPQIAQSLTAPPAIQPVEKPRLPLENVGPAIPGGTLKGPAPSTSVTDAIHDVVRGSVPGTGLTVGDTAASGSGYGGMIQNPANAVPASNVQLLSDPMGVDFTPYLRTILLTIRRNWQAVMPESVRLGRRGKVVIQFSINKGGDVGKLVYEQQSGADALDRAAVAGISASNPFPPLPSEFKGGRVVLRLNFAYNMPRQ
jgi:TonB family protein